MIILYNLIIILISWTAVYLKEKRNIFTIWLKPFYQRSKEFLKGFIFTAGLCIITQVLLSQLGNSTWILSKNFSLTRLLYSMYLDINSVLFEELLFRGVVLYLLIKYLNKTASILISAIAFGIYHWFTGGVLGNLMAMLVVFLVTGCMGYAFAIAYARTKSLILPFGLHLGWNLINHSMFSNGPNGTMILEVSEAPDISNSYQWISYGLYIIVAMLTLFFVKSKFIRYQPSHSI